MATTITPLQSPACTKVLETYELLERILLHLPLRTLLLSRGVNTSFEHVAQRSKSIRQALFLEPSSAGPIVADFKAIRLDRGNNEGPYDDGDYQVAPQNEWLLEDTKEVTIPLLNPFFASTQAHCRKRKNADKWYLSEDFISVTSNLRPGRVGGPVAPQYQAQGTEARMFLTQPPIQGMTCSTHKTENMFTYGKVESESIDGKEVGITVKTLLDAINTYLTSEGKDEFVRLCRTGGCQFLGCSVDEVTGYEVLEIFRRSVREHVYDVPLWDYTYDWKDIRCPDHRVDIWYDCPGHLRAGENKDLLSFSRVDQNRPQDEVRKATGSHSERLEWLQQYREKEKQRWADEAKDDDWI